jgi:hypothetical protein
MLSRPETLESKVGGTFISTRGKNNFIIQLWSGIKTVNMISHKPKVLR